MSGKVTCIMPCSRNEDLPRAIQLFLAQDYQDKELIIGLDSLDSINIPPDVPVFTFYEGVKETIGTKRNRLINACKSEIILHIDSDDYYAPDWITKSVQALGDNDMTGLSSAYFVSPDQARLYAYRGQQPYVLGATMCYRRAIWERNPFKDISEGEDTKFCANGGKVRPHDYIEGFAAMITGNNTASHKQLHVMKEVEFPEIIKNRII